MSGKANGNRSNGLSQKQIAALRLLPPSQRAAARASYLRQPRRSAAGPPQVPVLRNARIPRPVPRARGQMQGLLARRFNNTRGPTGGYGSANFSKLCNMWDPLCPEPIPSAFSDGHAHVTVGMRRLDIKVQGGATCLIGISCEGGTPFAGCILHYQPEGADPALQPMMFDYSTLVMPTLAGYPHDNAGPTAGRSMKGGLYITNTTHNMFRGGAVHILNADMRLTTTFRATPGTETHADITDLFGQVINNAQTRQSQGQSFSTTKGIFCHPVDTTMYTRFVPWTGEHAGASSNGNFEQSDHSDARSMCQRWLKRQTYVSGQEHDSVRPMSTLWALIDRPPSDQTYTITARNTFYTRWPAAHVLGQQRTPMKTAPPSVVNAAYNAGEAAAHLLKDMEKVPETLAAEAVHAAMALAANA